MSATRVMVGATSAAGTIGQAVGGRAMSRPVSALAQVAVASRPVVIAAGGTGGHFFPAEALAAELMRRGHRIVLMTDARSRALDSTVFAQAEGHVIRGGGLAGRGVLRGAKALLSLAGGVMQARALLARIEPGVVVGFGGYPCFPPVVAARLLPGGPGLVLHEQNGVLGRANRFLAQRILRRGRDVLALSLGNTTRVPVTVTIEVTGNPVRPAIMELGALAYEPPGDTVNLLILGGSLGARVFSDIVPAALALLPAEMRARLTVTQQCREEDLARVRDAHAASGVQANLAPFFGDVAQRLRAAHLVIARAGASTVAELAVAGKPAILVPLPGAIDDHQTANARALADAGGAWVMPQTGFTPAALAERLAALLAAPDALVQAAAAAHEQGRADAAARLADLVEARMYQEVRS